jgi:hypothetical protein
MSAFRSYGRNHPGSQPAERVTTPPLGGPSPESLVRENVYLKQRNAQLQEDVTSLGAEATRLREIVERLHGRSAARAPNPLAGGQ